MAIIKKPKDPDKDQYYDETETMPSYDRVYTFSIEDLDKQIAELTTQIAQAQTRLASVEARKAAALAL